MRVRIKYLLWLGEKVGVREEIISIDKEETTVEEIINHIVVKYPILKKYLSKIFEPDNPFIVLVNGKPCGENSIVRDGDTITILPPVSGG